jgi:thiamine transporter ThiT
MNTLQKAGVGARWGLVMASLLSAWVLVIAAINGSLTLTSRTGESYFVLSIVAFYLAGGTASGAMLGMLSGLLRWRVGALLIGMLAATPLAIAFLVMEGRFDSWGRTETMFVIVFCAAFGGGGGLIVREFVRGHLRAKER